MSDFARISTFSLVSPDNLMSKPTQRVIDAGTGIGIEVLTGEFQDKQAPLAFFNYPLR